MMCEQQRGHNLISSIYSGVNIKGFVFPTNFNVKLAKKVIEAMEVSENDLCLSFLLWTLNDNVGDELEAQAQLTFEFPEKPLMTIFGQETSENSELWKYRKQSS